MPSHPKEGMQEEKVELAGVGLRQWVVAVAEGEGVDEELIGRARLEAQAAPDSWIQASREAVVEDLALGGKFWWNLLNFEDEGKNLGGGAHQGQNDWSRITGVMDL
ncbi:hypothetical protein PPACK8108_LOCUS22208 [Phakopsora pachyrhizi]|uniref:Uncharacterized protein n=1 Tax=Phakopsora pachyrhizi TaxID=170000 RepID=A0AAV0BM54_PHAPC|nr:hypothetical protein PPACK8108_LOCUS22208 [Phakopsora pachyrhizi]